MSAHINSIFGQEPLREGEYGFAYIVGSDGVTAIVSRTENFGDHGIGWFDIMKGEYLAASVTHRATAQVIYEEQSQ